MTTLVQKNEHMDCHLQRHVVADRTPHVMRPILLPSPSVNQRLPSGPAVIAQESLRLPEAPWAAGRGNGVIGPLGVMRPIWRPPLYENRGGPAGPVGIPPPNHCTLK